MAIWHIAYRKIKTMLFNPVMIIVLIGLPLFQIFIVKDMLGNENADSTGKAVESFVEVTLVGLKISVSSLNAASVLVQFLLISGIIGASMLIQEREKNILTRIFSLPISRKQIILGNVIGQVIVSFFVAVAVILISKGLLGISWGSSWINISIVTILVLYVATALGFTFAGLFRSFKVANGVMIFFVMLMTFMAGGFSLDERFEATGKFTINKWAFDAYAKLMDGKPLNGIMPNLLVLTVIGTVLLILAFTIYRRENIYE